MSLIDRVQRWGPQGKGVLVGPSELVGPISDARRGRFASLTRITSPVDLYEITDGQGTNEGGYTITVRPFSANGFRGTIRGVGRIAVVRQPDGASNPGASPTVVDAKAARSQDSLVTIGPVITDTNDRLYVVVERRDSSILKYQIEISRIDKIWAIAGSTPSLDLRFAKNKSLADAVTGQNLITFTRSSEGTYIDDVGVLQTAANGVPRFDHSPSTGQCLGLMVEEQRTNSIRNNTMQGAVTGSPGILPTYWQSAAVGGNVTLREVASIGTESGIDYIDIRFTASGAGTIPVAIFEQNTQIAAAEGETWTSSVYLRLTGGTLANTRIVNRVLYRTSTGSSVSNNTVDFIPTSAPLITQRSVSTLTAVGSTIQRITNQVVAVTTGPSDFTVRIGLPQLERGFSPTSVIRTTNAAVTRSGDVASISGGSFSGWYRQEGGALLVEAVPSSVAQNGLVGFDDGTSNERWHVGHQGTESGRLVMVDGGVPQIDTNSQSQSWVVDALGRAAAAVELDNSALSVNGQAAIGDSSCSLPAVTQVTIGTAQGANYANSKLRRLTYWSTRLPNSKLEDLTR